MSVILTWFHSTAVLLPSMFNLTCWIVLVASTFATQHILAQRLRHLSMNLGPRAEGTLCSAVMCISMKL